MNRQIPRKSAAVTPSDTAYLAPPSSLFVGTAGDLNVLLIDDDDTNTPAEGTVFKNVEGVFPYAVKKVFDTSTTADDIVIAW